MIALLRQRNFGLLWFAGIVSFLGDWVLMIALPFYVYDLTGSALATGATFMASTLPRVLLSSVAGVFVDRWDRKWTLVVADVTRGLSLLALLLVHSADILWLVYAVTLLQATLGQFFSPAKSAFLPRLVSEDELLPANAINSLSDNLTRLVGPALGGLLYGVLGLTSVVLLDAASFIISGLMIALITASGRVASATTTTPARGVSTVWHEWRAGLRIIAHDRILAGIFIVMGMAMLGEGFLQAVLIPFVKVAWGSDALQLGWLMSAQAVGGVIGGLLIGRVGKMVPPLRLIAISGILNGLVLIGVVNSPSLTPALFLMALAGLPIVGFFVSMQTLLQTNTTDLYRGRVSGAMNAVAAGLTLVGMLMAGLLGDCLGVITTMGLGAVGYGLAGALAFGIRPARTVASAGRHEQVETSVSGD